jgi:hypothetical protein
MNDSRVEADPSFFLILTSILDYLLSTYQVVLTVGQYSPNVSHYDWNPFPASSSPDFRAEDEVI